MVTIRRPVMLYSALGLIVVLAVASLDVTVTAWARVRRDGKSAANAEIERQYRVPSLEFHHGLKPMVSAVGSWGELRYPIHTNSLGFKDLSRREVALRGTSKRILFIGDSFTEGVGLPYESTFVGLIDSKLAKGGYETLNAAVSSYYPDLYYKKVRHLIGRVGLKFDHLVVFIDISDIQDEALAVEPSLKKRVNAMGTAAISNDPIGVMQFIRERTTLPRLVYRVLRKSHPRSGNQLRSRWTLDEDLYESYGKIGVELARKHMDQLQELLKLNAIPLTVVVYPWTEQVLEKDINSKQVRIWKDWAAKNSVEFIDLFPAFIGVRAPQEVRRDYFFPEDDHWNEAGHRLVAEEFLSRWFARKLVNVEPAHCSSADNITGKCGTK